MTNVRRATHVISNCAFVGLVVALAMLPSRSANAEERLYWVEAVESKIPATPELIARGKYVYEKRCVLCHGKSGFGNGSAADYFQTRPRDFSSGQFKFLTSNDFPSDEDLFRSITVGFPAFGMPEFTYLSARERWGLVYYVKELGQLGFRETLKTELLEERLGLSPEALTPELRIQHQRVIEKIETDSSRIASYRFESNGDLPVSHKAVSRATTLQSGKEAYFRLGCNKCHGDAGHADGPSSDSLLDDDGRKTTPRDFSANRWYFKGGERVEDIVRTLIAGMPGTPMASFYQGPASLAGLWDVAEYVRSLANLDSTTLGEAQE